MIKFLLLVFVCSSFAQNDSIIFIKKSQVFTATQDYILFTQSKANELKWKLDTLDALKKITIKNDSIIQEYKKITYRDSLLLTLNGQKMSFKDSTIIQYQNLLKSYDEYLKAAEQTLFSKYKFWIGCGVGIVAYSAILIQIQIAK
jgi:hypothetical protein